MVKYNKYGYKYLHFFEKLFEIMRRDSSVIKLSDDGVHRGNDVRVDKRAVVVADVRGERFVGGFVLHVLFHRDVLGLVGDSLMSRNIAARDVSVRIIA